MAREEKLTKCQEIERSIIKKYRKQIWGKFVASIQEFEMIQDNDKIAVCISGGKDSMLLAKCMQELKRHSDTKFDVIFIVMDPGYNKANLEKIKYNAKLMEIPIEIFNSNIFNVVTDVEANPCYLCARMRRGCLYEYAKKRGCNKIALGHHFDDIIETLLMSILYGSQIQGMLPKLKSTNHPGMELIRPLSYVKEKDIKNWAKSNGLEFIRCACRFTEGLDLGKEDSKRQEVKNLIESLRKIYPNVDMNIYRSLYNVNLDMLIGYKQNGIKHFYLDDYNKCEKRD